jgi:uncharacterized membrane protein YdbT with pleckstrin-like domain
MRTPLQPNEKILLRTHTNWTVLVLPTLIAIIALTFGIWLGTATSLVWAAIVILPALGYFGWKYLEWKHNIWVITNFRVIDEFGIFNINTKESPLDKINNVSYSQSIWGRLFGFGNVEIQTAATIGETIYYYVDNPKTLKDTITHAQSNYNNERMSHQFKNMMQQVQPPQPAQPQQPTTTYVAPPQQRPAPQPNNHSIATELEKLFELKQKGILNEEEYQRAKGRLLG